MQGWRSHMEDAHIAELDLDYKEGVRSEDLRAIFGVFDGHGSDAVSKFVAKYFVQELLRAQPQEPQVDTALVNNFLRMDRCVLSPEGTRAI